MSGFSEFDIVLRESYEAGAKTLDALHALHPDISREVIGQWLRMLPYDKNSIFLDTLRKFDRTKLN